MEIFASMLDYDSGDRLSIYPMWEVATDGSRPQPPTYAKESTSPVVITNKGDIDKISNLYTLNASGTPFTPVESAYNFLRSSSASEKWLIILSDGAFDSGLNEPLRDKLLSMASDEIKIQYLGFAEARALDPFEERGFYTKKSTDASLMQDLVSICNSIFQRSILPAEYFQNNGNLTFDISMRKVIVFAQGQGANIKTLKNSDGDNIKALQESGQRKFSEISVGKYYVNAPSPIDNTLYGEVVTFDSCPKGTYKLDCPGAEAVQIFYEPDVDMEVTLTNSDGEKIEGTSGEIEAGKYTVNSRIVDRKTGEDVTNHVLMGNEVNITTNIKTADEASYTEYPNGAEIELLPNTETDILVVGRYLKDYKITSDGNANLAWLKGLKITEPRIDFEISAECLEKNSRYLFSKHEDWKPVRVEMTADGLPLTDEQLSTVKLEVVPNKDIALRAVPVAGESAYEIYVGEGEDGKYVAPERGKYKLEIKASLTDEYGNEIPAADKESFRVAHFSKMVSFLLILLLIIAIIVLITIIRNIPTLPSAVYLQVGKKKTGASVRMNGNVLDLSSNDYNGEIRCEAKAASPLKDKNSTGAVFEVKDIRPAGSVTMFSIDGEVFRRTRGKYLNSDEKTVSQMSPRIRVSDYTELKWTTPNGTVVGKILINHKD